MLTRDDADTSARPWWRAVPRLLPVVIITGYAFALLFRLNLPGRIIFDETYYVNDARAFLQFGGVEESFAVHPPVGKWLIAASIRLFGDNTLGWRFVGMLAGVGIAVLVWRIARRLFATRWAANVALFLLVTDGLLFVQARTAMLDIYLAFFVVAAAWLVVRDLDRPPDGRWRVTPWRWGTGVVLGLAIATKWSGLLALGAAGLVVLITESTRWRAERTTPSDAGDEGGADPEAGADGEEGDDAPTAEPSGVAGRPGVGTLVKRLTLGVAIPLVLVPVGVYLTTYVPWLANYEHTTEGKEDCPGASDDPATSCDVDVTGRLAGLWREHIDIMRFHRDLESEHPYRAKAWSWPVMGRPISYYYETCPEDPTEAEEPCEIPAGKAAEVLAVGNPALWWGFAVLVPVVTSGMRRGRREAWVPGLFWLAQVAPWMVVARPAFFFYMVPAVPFMALATGFAVERLREEPDDRTPWTGAASWGVVAALVVGLATRSVLPAAAAFGTGWTLGPLTADTWLTRRRRDGRATAPAADPLGEERPERVALPWTAVTVTALLVVLAGALFVHFWPIWTGLPMDPADLRLRWWFRSWI